RALDDAEVGPDARREQLEEAALIRSRQRTVRGEQVGGERDSGSLALARQQHGHHRLEAGGRGASPAAPPAGQTREESLGDRAHLRWHFPGIRSNPAPPGRGGWSDAAPALTRQRAAAANAA